MKRRMSHGHARRSILGRSRVTHFIWTSDRKRKSLRNGYYDKVALSTMPPPAPAWLLLVTNLPGHNPTLRMRLWRALKAAGAGLLRDGAYLLPNGERSRRVLEEQGAEIKAAGGLVQVLSFDAESEEQSAELVALFARTEDYAEAIERLDALKGGLAKLTDPEARQQLAAIAREVAA